MTSTSLRLACFASLLAVTALVGCDAAAPGPDASGDTGSFCATDDDCDAGNFCDGPPLCAPGAAGADARGCVLFPNGPCREGQSCVESRDACVTDCAVTRDADGDGAEATECGGADCDDANRSRAPGATEVCDTEDLDEDCDPRTFGIRDLDADGEADGLCCNEASDGERTCGRDCDDTRAGVGPTSPEVCNSIDDDCDGAVDEGVTSTFHRDADRDTHGDPLDFQIGLCGPSGEYSATMGDDCDDSDPLVFPSARELCNGRDDDCSSGGGPAPAEDGDGDGHTASSYTGCESIPSSFQRDDCDDGNPLFHPGAEYQHAPFCRVAAESCRRRDTGEWTCGMREPSGYVCEAELSSSDYTWDYDCSGAGDIEPTPDGTECGDACSIGAASCGACDTYAKLACAALVPLERMFRVSGSACGAPATYRTCGGASCDTCFATDVTLPVRCR